MMITKIISREGGYQQRIQNNLSRYAKKKKKKKKEKDGGVATIQGKAGEEMTRAMWESGKFIM